MRERRRSWMAALAGVALLLLVLPGLTGQAGARGARQGVFGMSYYAEDPCATPTAQPTHTPPPTATSSQNQLAALEDCPTPTAQPCPTYVVHTPMPTQPTATSHPTNTSVPTATSQQSQLVAQEDCPTPTAQPCPTYVAHTPVPTATAWVTPTHNPSPTSQQNQLAALEDCPTPTPTLQPCPTYVVHTPLPHPPSPTRAAPSATTAANTQRQEPRSATFDECLTPTYVVLTPPTAHPTNTARPTWTAAPPVTTRTPAPVTNVLRNPGFERDGDGDGAPDGWSRSRHALRSNVVVHGGSYALRHVATANSSYRVSQQVADVQGDRRYRLGGWTNIPPTSDSFTYELLVVWLNGAGGIIRADQAARYSGPTGGWVWASHDLWSPPRASSALVVMNVTSLGATIYADDLVFGRVGS